DPDQREQMDHARHLAKYVFARQYGLASPFKFQLSKYEAFKFPNFDDREHAIKGSSFKTPRRLKEVIPLLEKLLWRHGKCAYKLLRDHACPSKVFHRCFDCPASSCRSLSIRSKRSSGRTSIPTVSSYAFPRLSKSEAFSRVVSGTYFGTYLLGPSHAKISCNERHLV
ncbi:hypothetical protein C8R45DRAFT_813124, partial [Mycena sanguinolenta]